jgi:hypothetical protein
MWSALSLNASSMPQPPYKLFYSAQFAVTREAIRARPVQFWQSLFEFMVDKNHTYELQFGNVKERGYPIEYMWYNLFHA